MTGPNWDDLSSEPPVQSSQQMETPNWEDLHETPEAARYSTTGQQALTAVEQVAQGALGPIASAGENYLSRLGIKGITPKEREARAEANPIISTGSKVAGFAIPAAFTGGASAEAREAVAAGQLTQEAARGSSALAQVMKHMTVPGLSQQVGEAAVKGLGIESSVGKAAAQYAAEMSALQGFDEMAKMIDNDPNQTLGSAAINIGLSGIIGGAGGAVLGSVTPLWRTLKAGESDGFLRLMKNKAENVGIQIDPTFKEFTEDMEKAGTPIAPEIKARLSEDPNAANMFMKLRESGSSSAEALVQTIDATKELAQQRISNVVSGGMEHVSPFEAGERAKQSIFGKAEAMDQSVQDAYNKVGDSKQIMPSDEAKLKHYEKIIEEGQNFGANGSPQQNLFKYYAERLISQDNIGQIDKLNTEIGGELSKAWRAGDTETYKALAQIRDGIRDFQDHEIGKAVASIAKPPKPTVSAAEYQGRNVNAEDIYHQDLAKEVVKQRQEARSAYHEFMNNLSEMAGFGNIGKVKNYSQFQEKLNNIPSAKLADRMFDKKNIEKLMTLQKEHPDIFEVLKQQQRSSIIEDSSKSGSLNHNTVLNKVNSLPKEVKPLLFTPEELKSIDSAAQTIKTLNVRLNPSGTAGTLDKLWSHMPAGVGAVLSMVMGHGIIGGAVAGQAAKFLGKDAPDMVKLALLKSLGTDGPIETEAVKSMADYFKAANKGQELLNNAAKAIFRGGAEIIPRTMLPTEESRKRLDKALTTMSENPESTMKIGGNIGHYLQSHGTAAAALSVTAQNYLMNLKPKIDINAPLDNPAPADKSQQAKYDRALDIAQQPLMIMEHINKGTLQAQDLQTLNAIYPGLHTKLVNKVGEELINAKNDKIAIPYNKKMGLSMLIGSPLDSTMTPISMQSIMHSAGAQQQAQQQANGSPKKASGVELRQINKSNAMYATKTEQRELNRRQ